MTQALGTTATEQRGIVFRLGDRRYTIDSTDIAEVIRRPQITRVPHGPPALVGIASLRGVPLPVVDLNFLQNATTTTGTATRVIVCDRGNLVGLLVDEVLRFGASDDPAHCEVLDLDSKLEAAFKPAEARRSVQRSSAAGREAPAQTNSADTVTLLSFLVANQTYALRLQSIHEVLAFPNALTIAPGADASIIGLTHLRERVLPVVSLAALLGLAAAPTDLARRRVVVVEHEGSWIGLAVDQMDAIRRLSRDAIGPVPPVLRRGSGPADIEAIGRADQGRTLISILSAEKLFGHRPLETIIDRNHGGASMSGPESARDAEEQFLIFKLGDETYGLPIGAVDEVIRVPDAITRMPNAPAFVTGVMNLRGKALPLIDQRSRFEAPHAADSGKPRAIVLTIDKLQAGFIVDAVSEVVAFGSSALSVAPEFSSETTEVFDRVAHIEADGRMILIVDPRELLSRAERDVVAALADREE
ncbi:MAG: chemotaxis protein CheW [Rhizobiaceae bacterium]|nr:chemotaxis protein CheW [Rhizobiaceae bacterium]